MGIISIVVPCIPSQKKIPRNNVTTQEILRVGQVETHFKSSKICNQPCFELLNLVKVCDATSSLDDLWNCAWLLKPHRPMWNGFMQMMHNGVSKINSICVICVYLCEHV